MGIPDALGISHILLRFIYVYDCYKLKCLDSRHAFEMASLGLMYIYIYLRAARWAFTVHTVYRILLVYMHMCIYMYVYMIALVQTA